MELTKREFTPQEFLLYYKNTWIRNAAARTIDVQTDRVKKAADPEEMVEHEGKIIPVKERLELRKIGVQEALDIVNGADALLKTDLAGKTFAEVFWSADALKVDADMMPKEPKEGDECDLDDKSGKGVLGNMEGKLVCVKKEQATHGSAPENNKPDAEAKV